MSPGRQPTTSTPLYFIEQCATLIGANGGMIHLGRPTKRSWLLQNREAKTMALLEQILHNMPSMLQKVNGYRQSTQRFLK
jgi:hypothetical protein